MKIVLRFFSSQLAADRNEAILYAKMFSQTLIFWAIVNALVDGYVCIGSLAGSMGAGKAQMLSLSTVFIDITVLASYWLACQKHLTFSEFWNIVRSTYEL